MRVAVPGLGECSTHEIEQPPVAAGSGAGQVFDLSGQVAVELPGKLARQPYGYGLEIGVRVGHC